MIHVIFTVRDRRHELDLPYRVEDVLSRSVPYFLLYGQAAVEFVTPDPQLNEGLNKCIQQTSVVSLHELNTLALLLSRMDAQRLGLLSENLPAGPCSCAELTRRACYYGKHYLTQDGEPDPQAAPLEEYDYTWDGNRLEEGVSRRFRQELDDLRLTGGQLFEKVMERAKENSDLAQVEPICDYTLPDRASQGKLTSYEFDFVPIVSFGGSEGIYIDCSLRGKFDESGRDRLHIGTIKTLDTDLAACKLMGELCGALLYHEYQYVNDNIYLFDSTESIEKRLSNPLKLAPAMSMEAQEQEIGQQMC